jgi:hypothetical protein
MVSVRIETPIATARANNSPIPTELTRPGFVQMGGALFVSLALPVGFSACKRGRLAAADS